MELKRNVRKFLFSSIYVTAAISGHMMIFVWSIKLICNKTKTEIYYSKRFEVLMMVKANVKVFQVAITNMPPPSS